MSDSSSSVVKKLAIVAGAVLATGVVCAYPAAVYYGNRVYDAEIQKFVESNKNITYTELEKSYSSRTGVFKVKYLDKEFVLNSKTNFGVSGVTTVFTPDNNSSGMQYVKEQIGYTPDFEAELSYSILGDQLSTNTQLKPGKFKINDLDFECEYDKAILHSKVARKDLVKATPDAIFAAIRAGKGFYDYELTEPSIKCNSNELNIDNIKLTGKLVSYNIPVFSELKVDGIKVHSTEEYGIKNLTYSTDTLKGDNETYGSRSIFKISEINIPDFISGSENKLFKNLNVDVTLEDLSRENFLLFSDYQNALGNSEKLENVNLKLKVSDISVEHNNGVLKINGNLAGVTSNFEGFDANIHASVTKPFVDGLKLGEFLKIGKMMGYINSSDDNLYESNLVKKADKIIINGKDLKL